MENDYGYIVLDEADYKKAIGQLRLAVGAILSVFNMYGMQEFIPQAQEEIVKVAEDFGLRVRGIDKPISLEYIRRSK